MPNFRPNEVSQRQSTKLDDVDAQLQLLPQGKTPSHVDKGYLLGLPTMRRALRYSISLADLEPKQVYEPLEYDKAVWSRIESGVMDFPACKLNRLRLLTGNSAPLMWLAQEQGFELRPLKSELQDRLEQAEAANVELRRQLATITEFVRNTQGAR